MQKGETLITSREAPVQKISLKSNNSVVFFLYFILIFICLLLFLWEIEIIMNIYFILKLFFNYCFKILMLFNLSRIYK